MLSRRSFLAASAVIGLPTMAWATDDFRNDAAALEQAAQGRLGLHVIDTGTGREYGWRADERFMMLSSSKLPIAALALARVDRGEERLDRLIRYGRDKLLSWAPVAEKHVDDGLTVAELCAGMVAFSDNTAANLLMDSFGGPSAVTAFLRRIGDTVSRLDRHEPELNTPDGEKDTTTPAAMAHNMHRLLLGDALSPSSRRQLRDWLLGCKTGDKRLRAGVPAGWQVGNKTGTNRTDANDIGILLPPGRQPLLVAAYLAGSTAPMDVKEATLAGAGRLAASRVAG
jgi:beta-lactamase class A